MSRSGSPHDLGRLDAATAHLDAPFAIVDMAAFRANAAAMTRRAGGKPIRLASKSVRCRSLIEQVLAMDGYRGVLAYTLPEASGWRPATPVTTSSSPTRQLAGARWLA